MSKYRGYFMRDDHIVAPAVIDADDDAQAMLKAGEMLSASQCTRMEVWQETRLVGALSAPTPTDRAKLDEGDRHLSESGGSTIVEFRHR